MWNFKAEGGTRFNFNDDLSGEVYVTVGPEDKKVTVFIPAQDILDFVAEHIRLKKISDLENASTEELLTGRKS
jgi:hypothetical protein